MSDNPAGVWIVTSYAYHALPEAIFDNELKARRWSDLYDNTMTVDFMPFGVEWDKRWVNGVRPESDDD